LGGSFEHGGSFLAVSGEGRRPQEVLACVVMISNAAGEVSCHRREEVAVPQFDTELCISWRDPGQASSYPTGIRS
jgi:hypothetical protein